MKASEMPEFTSTGRTKPARPLTNRGLEALSPEALPYRVPDSRCSGLAARVAPNGVITWDLAFRIKGGKGRRLSLGRYPDVTLEKARDEANQLTRAGRAGRDMLAEREAASAEQASRITVDSLIQRYMKAKRLAGLRTCAEMESRLLRSLAGVRLAAAASIRRRQIGELLDEVAESGREREAEKRRQLIGAMFRWGIRQDLLENDPTLGLTPYDPGTPRDRVLSQSEVETFFGWLEVSGLPHDHADVLRMELAIGARCGEVAGMQSSEVDHQTLVWTLPSSRSKNRRPRSVPLVGLARSIVARRLHRTGALFRSQTGKVLTASHVGQALINRRANCPIAHFNTHDLRRTFVTGLVDMDVPIELIAAIVGHVSGGRETRTLMRHYVKTEMLDRKHSALLLWDDRLQTLHPPR